MRCKVLWLEKIIYQSYANTPFNGNTPWLFEDIFNSYSITNTFTGVNLTHFRSILTTQPKSSINLSIRAYIPVTHASLSKLFVPSARIARGTMLSCARVCVRKSGFPRILSPETTFEQCSFDFRITRRHGNFSLQSLQVLFNDLGKLSIWV